MPNKEKLKNPSANPRKKPKYKVTNWTDYNKSLRKRGAISLYFPKGDVALQFVNRKSYIPGLSGLVHHCFCKFLFELVLSDLSL